MSMFEVFYENLPDPIRRQLKSKNQTTMEFPSGSKLVIRTAGGKGGVRSFTANFAVLSEFAFYENAEEVMATVIPALNGGRVILESTPNFFGDPLHTRFLQSQDDSSFKTLFFPWYEHKDYTTETEPIALTQEESDLKVQLNLTDEQIAWRRAKIKKMGLHKFQRDYPITIAEAYSQGATAFIGAEDIEGIKPITILGNEWRKESPRQDTRYALGADTSMGIGRDYSWLWVIDAKTRKPVYTWFSNTVTPAQFADKILHVATEYNRALVLVESNNTGLVTCHELKRNNYANMWGSGKDWITTSKSKPELMEILRQELSKGLIDELDVYTLAQLRGLQVEKNSVIFPKNEIGHADSVMALSLAYRALNDVVLPDNRLPFRIPHNQRRASYSIK